MKSGSSIYTQIVQSKIGSGGLTQQEVLGIVQNAIDDSLVDNVQPMIDSSIVLNNTNIVLPLINSRISNNNTTVVTPLINSSITTNNTAVVTPLINSSITTNNTAVVTPLINSSITTNNTAVVTPLINSSITTNNTAVVTPLINSSITTNNTAVVTPLINTSITTNNTSYVAPLVSSTVTNNNKAIQLTDQIVNAYLQKQFKISSVPIPTSVSGNLFNQDDTLYSAVISPMLATLGSWSTFMTVSGSFTTISVAAIQTWLTANPGVTAYISSLSPSGAVAGAVLGFKVTSFFNAAWQYNVSANVLHNVQIVQGSNTYSNSISQFSSTGSTRQTALQVSTPLIPINNSTGNVQCLISITKVSDPTYTISYIPFYYANKILLEFGLIYP